MPMSVCDPSKIAHARVVGVPLHVQFFFTAAKELVMRPD